MAVAGVLLGIVAGLLAAGLTLTFSGGLGLALLAYVAGGMAGLAGGLVTALVPRRAWARAGAPRRA
jgi:hypothetical protein